MSSVLGCTFCQMWRGEQVIFVENSGCFPKGKKAATMQHHLILTIMNLCAISLCCAGFYLFWGFTAVILTVLIEMFSGVVFGGTVHILM